MPDRIVYEFYLRPVRAETGEPIPLNQRGMKFCSHRHAVLVNVQPDPAMQDGVINPSQNRFVLYCPDCGNFIDYIHRDADASDDDIPF